MPKMRSAGYANRIKDSVVVGKYGGLRVVEEEEEEDGGAYFDEDPFVSLVAAILACCRDLREYVAFSSVMMGAEVA